VTAEHESGHERPVYERHARAHPEPVHFHGVTRGGASIHKDRLDLLQVGEVFTPDMGRSLDESRRRFAPAPGADYRGSRRVAFQV
jgi:hypothetical protein